MYSNLLLAGSVNFFNTCPEVSIWHLHLHLSYYTCMYEAAISIQPAHPVRLVKWLVPGWVTMSCGHGMTLHQTCHGTSHGSSDPCWWPLQFFPVSSMLHARQIQGGGEQVPKHKVQPPETEKLFSRILSLLAAVLRGAGDSLESNQTTTYVSPIWDHSGLWLKSKDPNTISNKYVQMSQHVPTILSKTQC